MSNPTDPDFKNTNATLNNLQLRSASVIPLHQVEGIQGLPALGIPVRRGPGRPKKIESAPDLSTMAYHAEVAKQQTDYVGAHELKAALEGNAHTGVETLRLIQRNMAKVAAILDFRRIEDEKRGGLQSPQILSRHLNALSDMAALEIKIQNMQVAKINLRSPEMAKVFKLFVEKLSTIAREVLPQEQSDLLFNRFETELQGWEEEAESLIR